MGLHLPLAVVPTNFGCERSCFVSCCDTYFSRSLLTSAYGNQILFLNKDDIFREKILHSDIKNHFPVRLMSLVQVLSLV